MFVAREEDDLEGEDDNEDDTGAAMSARTKLGPAASSTIGSSSSSTAAPSRSSGASGVEASSNTSEDAAVGNERGESKGSSHSRPPVGGHAIGDAGRNRGDGSSSQCGSARSSEGRACAAPMCDSSQEEEEEMDGDREPCEDLWETTIKPQFDEIIAQSLACVMEEVKHRKNTVELYGYDFMISDGPEKPQVWLIEVNSSPACDYSTPVTCPLVKQMMEDTAKVMVDLKEDPDGSTGGWDLLQHKHGKVVSMRFPNCPQLVVNGKEIVPPKNFKRKKKKRKQKAKQQAVGESDDDEEEDAEEAEESDEDDADDLE